MRKVDYRVIVASPFWGLSGVNVFSANLTRALCAGGIDARLLVTEHDTTRVTWSEARLPLPNDVPVETLPVHGTDGWGTRWRAMVEYLEARAPCVYIPNHDWRHSCVSPLLSNRVAIVGAVHSDDPLHYDHVARLGAYWNAIVTVSAGIAERIVSEHPAFAARVSAIPNGVPIPLRFSERASVPDAPLRIIVASKLTQYQKRVFDVPKILAALERQGVPFHLTVAGDGPDAEALKQECADWIAREKITWLGIQPHARVLELFEQHDVFLLTSEFEGMPEALLEAMARGCVPVVTDIRSGIPEVVRDGANGFRVPVGNVESFATRLARLQREPALRAQMARAAYETIKDGGFSTGVMARRYLDLFEHVWDASARGTFVRPRGKMVAPPQHVAGISILPMDASRQVALTNEAFSWKRFFFPPARRLKQVGKRGSNALSRLVRADNWWRSKIPPILAMAYLQMLLQPVAPARAYATLVALLFSTACLAAYGHVINDIFDIEADQRAGKPNGVVRLAVWQRWALLALLGVLGLMPWLFVRLDALAVFWLALICFVLTFYSAPPIRFKSRDRWAIFADAIMAHAGGTLFALTLVAGAAEPPTTPALSVMLAAGSWSLLVGLRGVLLGQIWDWANDVHTGTVTLTTRVGVAPIRAWITRIIFPAELLTLGALGLVVFPIVPALLLLGMFALGLDWAKLKYVWRQPFDPAPARGAYVPPHDLYQVWLPIGLAALLLVRDLWFLPLLAIQILLCYRDLRDRQILQVCLWLVRRVWLKARRGLIGWIRRIGATG